MKATAKSSFIDRYTADILGVSLGALAIVIFLSIAFVWYDGSNLPSSNSSTVETNHGVIEDRTGNHGVIENGATNHGVIKREDSKQHERDQRRSEDLVAIAAPTLPRMPFHFVSNTSASLAGITINASLAPDNTMWRYTKEGWRDISLVTNPPPVNKPLLEGVHPIIWTAMLLMVSLLLLIAASSDEEIRQLLGQTIDHKKER